MSGVHRVWGRWEAMFHGIVFVEFLVEPGDRHRTGGFSTHQVGSANWFMTAARRRLSSGWIGVRGMVSLEPWTLEDCGYISFLATGETCDRDTIHDRQHPHDAVMELAAEYDRPLGGSLRWQVYGGLAGEPALGPPGFPHRLSAQLNPIAPIAHHWLDSSHVTFGLVTTGIYRRTWKAEVSAFNGREPDEHRADLDLGPLDSLSARLSVAPGAQVVMQVSAAHLEEAEFEFPPQPRTDVDRVTASATVHRPLSDGGYLGYHHCLGAEPRSRAHPGRRVPIAHPRGDARNERDHPRTAHLVRSCGARREARARPARPRVRDSDLHGRQAAGRVRQGVRDRERSRRGRWWNGRVEPGAAGARLAIRRASGAGIRHLRVTGSRATPDVTITPPRCVPEPSIHLSGVALSCQLSAERVGFRSVLKADG